MSLASSDIKGPLGGVTVIDLTRVLAGPFCTMTLADLGARVIKVEVPGPGDDARAYGPFVGGKSAYFISVNRGKESIALDLKNADDCVVFEALLAEADVVIENYRPGTMEKLGYGWDTLHARFPRLIYAAVSGFGHSGPYMTRPAYDVVVQAMGGIMSLTGQPGNDTPTRVGTSVGDITAGLFTAIGITSALYRRTLSGEGFKVDVGMLDCQIAILENAIARTTTTGKAPGPLGTRHPSIAPFEMYRTADGWLVLAAGNDAVFRKLAVALGRPQLGTDPRFLTNDDRAAHVEALKLEIEAGLSLHDTAHWLTIFTGEGIPCGPYNDVAQALAEPQVKARNMVIAVDDPATGVLHLAGNPIKTSAFPDPTTRPAAPDLNADGARIRQELGLK
jgi:CoA:oxalate CoA-transferase